MLGKFEFDTRKILGSDDIQKFCAGRTDRGKQENSKPVHPTKPKLEQSFSRLYV